MMIYAAILVVVVSIINTYFAVSTARTVNEFCVIYERLNNG